MSNIYYIDIERKRENHAGVKAPEDIAAILDSCGYKRIVFPHFPTEKNWLYKKIWLFVQCMVNWNNVFRIVKKGDLVIFQHPIYGQRVSEKMIPKIKSKTGCKFIALIHDLESLRGGIQGVYSTSDKTSEIADNVLLRHFDAIICHNLRMKEYLISQGFDDEKLVCLEIFDYLSEYQCSSCEKSETPSIVIAGNLAKGKCGYIYEICPKRGDRNTTLSINLFGGNYEQEYASPNMIWHGSFDPEELPKYLKGDFGLVWDGTSIETCKGNTGEYLKYNNPHKISLYLSSGVPVIVWEQSAMAAFVLKHNVGLVVENLKKLDEIILSVTDEEYQIMRKNVEELSSKLQQGYFSKKAIQSAVEIIHK